MPIRQFWKESSPRETDFGTLEQDWTKENGRVGHVGRTGWTALARWSTTVVVRSPLEKVGLKYQ
jgi:hypothetical protein